MAKVLKVVTQSRVTKDLSENIKKLRFFHNWTQEKCARRVGVSISTIQRWEQRGGNPTHLADKRLKRLFREAGINIKK